MITPFEIKAVLALLGVLVSIIGFIGALMLKSFYKMAQNIEEMKRLLSEHAVRHETYQKTLEDHEERIRDLEHG